MIFDFLITCFSKEYLYVCIDCSIPVLKEMSNVTILQNFHIGGQFLQNHFAYVSIYSTCVYGIKCFEMGVYHKKWIWPDHICCSIFLSDIFFITQKNILQNKVQGLELKNLSGEAIHLHIKLYV